ncbi:MAG: retropepsin-like aspartic protease [Pseudomonadota bacterium]
MNLSNKAWVVLIVAGFLGGALGGWWYRGLSLPKDAELTGSAVDTESVSEERVRVQVDSSIPPISEAGSRSAEDGESPVLAANQSLMQLLSEQQFWDATNLYYQRVREDPAMRVALRPTFDSYLIDCRQNCEPGAFLDLVDAWLATFYDDVPVLIQLAEFQEDQGQPEAAANTLLLARTYAMTVDQQHEVQQARDRLTRRTDNRLEEAGSWIELLGYYDFLASIDFTTPRFELRRALLYRRLGEDARAVRLLNRLQANDDGRDPQLSMSIDSHLSEAPSSELPEENPVEAFPSSVPLEKYGTGFLVKVTFNERDTVRLLVDTGASITALTPGSFRKLYRPEVTLLGTQLFKTASGYTRGDIYSAASVALGKERIEGTTLAVLDRLEMGDVDGLLGMNVLRHFKFEIDRVGLVMYLERR